MALIVGLMSGTSLDGVDAVLASFEPDGRLPTLRAHAHRPYPEALRAELLALNAPSGVNELHRAALAANGVARAYAEVVTAVLEQAAVPPADVRALGAHGQTVRHRPGEFDGVGYTVQLLNASLLAELTGIEVVADFRSRDVVAGGQGAPLVPAFHAAVFGDPNAAVAVLNIGGIANLTCLPSGGPVLGFDCGPGNLLMDGWCERHTGQRFDDDGRWAAGGTVLAPLLARLMTEPFLASPPPKSTGRDLFSLPWLDSALASLALVPAARDVQATLAAFTVRCAAGAVARHAADAATVLVCGGGAFNGHLMTLLAAALPQAKVLSTAERGIAPDHVEALAFAWLAQACLQRRPGNLPEVTGARGLRVLGTLHPAG